MSVPYPVDFEALAQPGLRSLRAYDPGHDLVALRRAAAAGCGAEPLLELGSNECAAGPSPRALQAIAAALPLLHRYPDPLGGDLRRALCSRLGVDGAAVVLGNGSHELLLMLAQVFAGPGSEVLVSRHGFAVYALAARGSGARLQVVEALPRDGPMPLGHDLNAMAAAVGPRTRLVYLANPNNPTGTWFARGDLDRFLRLVPERCIVVVDEAYAEYVDERGPATALALLPSFPNLVVTRTFSKAYALAGLRVGYAVAHPGLAQLLERLRASFNVNALGLAAAEAALADQEHLLRVRTHNAGERAWLIEALRALPARAGRASPEVFPSQANFLLVGFGADAAPVEAALLQRGIVPRPMQGYGLPDCLRITIGTRAQNERLLAALRERP